MSNTLLIEAVKQGDRAKVRELIEARCDVNEKGTEQEWPALNFAAGKGDCETIKLLLERGADVLAVGRDNRTPYQIALAAGQLDACRVLQKAEEEAGGDQARVSSRSWETRPYCKAYRLGDLRTYQKWLEAELPPDNKTGSDETLEDGSPESIVFIHQDYSVTKSMWHGENVLFNQVTDEWKEFCAERLNFRVPHDFDLVPSGAE